METSEHYERVRKFMELAGQDTPDAPTELDRATRELRARLLMEEVMETIERGLGVYITAEPFNEYQPPVGMDQFIFQFDANLQYNPVELLDGCCDVNVITTGTLIAAGLTDAQPQRLVDENNLAKLGSGSWVRDDGKLMKAPDHQPPDLAGEIERQGRELLFEAE